MQGMHQVAHIFRIKGALLSEIIFSTSSIFTSLISWAKLITPVNRKAGNINNFTIFINLRFIQPLTIEVELYSCYMEILFPNLNLEN